MTDSEINSYKHMAAAHVRRWLTANCVVATAFAGVLFLIATNHFGRGFSSAVTHSIAAAEVSGGSQQD